MAKYGPGMGSRGQIAIYFLRALSAVLVCGVVWYLGNIILYGDVGIVSMTESMDNEGVNNFGDTTAAVAWFWQIFPWIFLVGAALYVLYGSIVARGG